ncbi:MAG: hypothetical protein J1F04_09095 [Oscillospiraceae bacterium]|nr:hypothetical protein [Oscillospiraceae bacterium]
MPLGLKTAALYTAFWTLFTVNFAVMFVLLLICALGIPSGIMLAVLGAAVLMFRADFVITALAPQVMIFGGLSAAFLSAFFGLLSVKMGFGISGLFIRIRRKCERLREADQSEI